MTLRRIAVPALALGLLTITSASAGAQVDARWRAWTGCWVAVSSETGLGPRGTVCVIPTDKASAVEIVTVAGNTITDRMRIDADGVAHTVSRDGCTGTEIAHFSPGGTRVHIRETTACEGGTTRIGSGIMSFDQTYQWLDVRGITSGTTAGVAVAKYRMLTDTTGLPAEVRAVVATRGAAANGALLAASAPLTLADIAEVGVGADSGVASAWLVERTRGLLMTLNGKQLAMLADQGVPASVIDVVVAIGHPRVFALTSSQEPQLREPVRAATTAGNSYWRSYPSFYGFYASPFYDPWYSFYAGTYSPYSYRYGYNPYGFGFGYNPYYGYYPGSQPIVVVNRPNDEPARSHGRVTRSGGYSSGSGSSSGSYGSPSSRSSGSGESGSGSSSSGGSSSGSSATSSGGGRVAVPKPPTDN